MQTVAILSFFSLVVAFFFTGRNDFGLRPTTIKDNSESLNKLNE